MRQVGRDGRQANRQINRQTDIQVEMIGRQVDIDDWQIQMIDGQIDKQVDRQIIDRYTQMIDKWVDRQMDRQTEIAKQTIGKQVDDRNRQKDRYGQIDR